MIKQVYLIILRYNISEIPIPRDKKREISPRLNAIIIANIWGADQVKNREIIENGWKILPGGGS